MSLRPSSLSSGPDESSSSSSAAIPSSPVGSSQPLMRRNTHPTSDSPGSGGSGGGSGPPPPPGAGGVQQQGWHGNEYNPSSPMPPPQHDAHPYGGGPPGGYNHQGGYGGPQGGGYDQGGWQQQGESKTYKPEHDVWNAAAPPHHSGSGGGLAHTLKLVAIASALAGILHFAGRPSVAGGAGVLAPDPATSESKRAKVGGGGDLSSYGTGAMSAGALRMGGTGKDGDDEDNKDGTGSVAGANERTMNGMMGQNNGMMMQGQQGMMQQQGQNGMMMQGQNGYSMGQNGMMYPAQPMMGQNGQMVQGPNGQMMMQPQLQQPMMVQGPNGQVMMAPQQQQPMMMQNGQMMMMPQQNMMNGQMMQQGQNGMMMAPQAMAQTEQMDADASAAVEATEEASASAEDSTEATAEGASTETAAEGTSAEGSTSEGSAAAEGADGETPAELASLDLNELANFKDAWEPWEKTDVPVFFHIPKAGGSTIKDVIGTCHRFVMATEFGVTDGHSEDEEVAIVYPGGGPEGQDRSPFVNVDTTTVEGIQRAAKLGFADAGLADAVVTPFIYESNDLFTPTAKGRLFTVFRHPIDRAISMFYYIQVADWEPTYAPELKDWTIEQYAQSDKIENNWLVRQLTHKFEGDLEDYDLKLAMEVVRRKFLVGLMTEIETTMTRCEQYFRWTYHVNPPNQEKCRSRLLGGGSNKNTKKKKVEEGSEAWELLAHQNLYDLQLYEYIEALFKEQAQFVAEVPEDFRNLDATCCKCGPPTYPPEGFTCPLAILNEDEAGKDVRIYSRFTSDGVIKDKDGNEIKSSVHTAEQEAAGKPDADKEAEAEAATEEAPKEEARKKKKKD